MDHIETLLRRAVADGIKPARLRSMFFQFAACTRFEQIHPVQGGFFRRKLRRQRRTGMPGRNPLLFYPRRYVGFLVKSVRMGLLSLRIRRIEKRILREPDCTAYTDVAITPVGDDDAAAPLGLYDATEAARAAVRKEVALRQTIRRARGEPETPSEIPVMVG